MISAGRPAIAALPGPSLSTDLPMPGAPWVTDCIEGDLKGADDAYAQHIKASTKIRG